jgi:hypothetical protein
MRLTVPAAALALAVLSGGCAAPTAAGSSALERLAGVMSGSFSSRAQAQADKRYFEIELQVARIWPERSDGPWLYVEQASAEARDKPYRQRIYRLQALADGTLVSWVYTLPGDALAYAGSATQPQRLGALQPAQLQLREGCEVRLRAEGPQFVGGTQGQACRSDLRGAAWASSEVAISADGMQSWDRGFDTRGQQVWGATAGAYRFDRTARQPAAAVR